MEDLFHFVFPHGTSVWYSFSSVRLLPTKMTFELYGMLPGNGSPMTGENVKPAYGGDDEAFLMKVVTPIYRVIEEEALRSKTMKSKHSHWRNYDDLNEYFWKNDCFLLGWPMRADADFFKTPKFAYPNRLNGEERSAGSVHWMGKINFC